MKTSESKPDYTENTESKVGQAVHTPVMFDQKVLFQLFDRISSDIQKLGTSVNNLESTLTIELKKKQIN